MKIFVDNEPIEREDAGADATVEDALHQVQADCGPAGRMVVGVRCDGRDVPADEMARTLVKPLASFERVDVLTGTRQALVIEAMTQAKECLAETGEACKTVAERLKEGHTVEAAQRLGECLPIWQQVHEAVGKSIEMLGFDPDGGSAGGESFAAMVGKPKYALLEMRDALQAQDYVLLADILEFEFTDALNAWHAVIAELYGEAERQKHNASR